MVVATTTGGNTSHTERGMKVVRDLWGRRSTHISLDKLAMQVRLHLNHVERRGCRQRNALQEAKNLAAAVKQLWEREDGAHRDGCSGARTQPRRDVAGHHRAKAEAQ